MDNLLDSIKKNRSVRLSTLDEYKRSLNTLSNAITEKKYESIDFILEKKDDIKKFLDNKSNSLQKKYLSAILVALSPKGKNQALEKHSKTYEFYLSLLNTQNQLYLNGISNNKKSDKDKEKWTTWKSILDVQKSLKKQLLAKGIKINNPKFKNNREFFLLQDYLIASLYTMLPPRRLDYADAIIISKMDFDRLEQKNKNDNVYLIDDGKKNKYFSFGKNAVKSETKENIKIDIPKDLNTILNGWLKANTTKNLLINKKYERLGKNALSKQLSNIFDDTGKKISVVMLRKIYLTEKFGDIKKEMDETGEAMNHSASMAQKVYIKN